MLPMFQSQQKLGGYDLNTSPPLAKETHKHKLEYKYRGIVLKTLLIYNIIHPFGVITFLLLFLIHIKNNSGK